MIGRSAQNDSFPWCRTLCDWSACKNEAGFLSSVLLLCGVSEVTTCEDNECVLMSNVLSDLAHTRIILTNHLASSIYGQSSP